MSSRLILRSKEEKEFEITKKAASLSNFLRKAMDEAIDDSPISLSEIDEKMLEKILEYLDRFNGNAPNEIEKPLPGGDMKGAIDEWSVNFVDKITLDDLVNLTIAANYLGINSLIDLCCAKFACMCKDKSEEEIFKVFNFNKTFTEDEKKELREKNRWIEENL